MGILKGIRDFFMAEEEPARPGPLHENLGRNDPCWCGSGKKYKKCHLEEDEKRPSKKMADNCARGT